MHANRSSYSILIHTKPRSTTGWRSHTNLHTLPIAASLAIPSYCKTKRIDISESNPISPGWTPWKKRTQLKCPGYIYSSLLSLQPSADAPSIQLAVAALFGLPLALWIYKCIMMIIFQRKIIYMGYVPPGARTEELGRDVQPPKGILCDQVQIGGDKGISLSGIVIRRDLPDVLEHKPKTVVLYLQGNAGNPLGRLPVFERLLLGMSIPDPSTSPSKDLAILAVAPRSYWKSSSRTPTEAGLLSDYRHALSYVTSHFPTSSIILYGHSLGGAIAVCLSSDLRASDYPQVKGLVLENPFASIPGMVRALYPQKWLPYNHMGLFVYDKWDALSAMKNASADSDSLLRKLSSSLLMILSEKDELVPNTMGDALFEAATSQPLRHTSETSVEGMGGRKVLIRNALHEHAWKQRQWLVEIRSYLQRVGDSQNA